MAKLSECTMQMKLVHDTMISIVGHQFSDSGITFSQINYLEYLYNANRPVPLKELERAFKVSQPTVVGIIKRLHQKELVMLERDAADYKSKNASLTEKGRELYELSESKRKKLQEKMYHGFSESDAEVFYGLLTKLYQNLTAD